MNLNQFNETSTAGQKAVLSATKRFPVVVTGIQAGKTTVGAVWLCNRLYKDYQAGIKGDYLIAAPTVKILQQSTLPKFKEILPTDWAVWKEANKVYELKWGGHIYVRSTDEPDSIEGMTIRAAWLDEVGKMKQSAWINVQGRLSVAMGPCLMTTTPYSLGWFWRDVVKKASEVHSDDEVGTRQFVHKVETKAGGDPNIALYGWPSNANPSFPQEEMDRARASLSKAIFERRYLGKFTQLEGLVYPDFDQDKDVVDPFHIPLEWERFGGQDFGKENPTCILGIARNPEDNTYYVFKEFYKSHSLLSEQATFISDNGLRQVWADPQSAQLILELNRSYHLGQVKSANNDIDIGVERLTKMFKQHQLKVFKNCTSIIDELETYHYPTPDSDGETKDKPVAKKNHACDALRYAFSKGTGSKLKPMDPLDTGRKRSQRRLMNQVTRSMLEHDSHTGY